MMAAMVAKARLPSFPAEWEELLWAAVRDEVSEAATTGQALVAAIQARTRRYTDARERLHERLTGAEADRDLAARALFFTVADAPKIGIPLAELDGRGLLPAASLRVLDVGAGAGAMTLGLLAHRGAADTTHVTAVDRDARALAILRRVAASLPRPPMLTTLRANLATPLPDGPFDVVLAGTVLNELAPAARAPLVRALLDRLAGGGAVILVEPALRETARDLHALRDALVAEGGVHVFAPCTHQRPCPALVDPRDWCHEDRPFQAPPRLAGLMRRTGLRDGGLKFAYLTLRRTPEPLVVAPPGARALRVVSGALDTKGVVERILCGEDGRKHVRLLRRERSESYCALDDSRRGDVLVEAERGLSLPPTSPARGTPAPAPPSSPPEPQPPSEPGSAPPGEGN